MLVGAALGLSGCSLMVKPVQFDQWNNGYTIVLPGIESRHLLHGQLAAGLRDGGVQTAIEIYDWTSGNPALMLAHLRWSQRNQRQAQEIANKIVAYQDRFPGKPVHLIGHSGGAGVAVLALESLPDDRRINSVVLLGACISPSHDLRTALQRCERLYNYYSIIDAPLLVAGTTLAGTIDNRWEPSAGATGFCIPANLDENEAAVYQQRLHQRHFQLSDVGYLSFGGHYGAMSRWFAKHELSEVLRRD
jgi:pimeloyl-ACP methyl ester carboxylesterase